MNKTEVKITPAAIIFLLMGIIPVFQKIYIAIFMGDYYGYGYNEGTPFWIYLRIAAFLALGVLILLNQNQIFLTIPIGVIAITYFAMYIKIGIFGEYMSFFHLFTIFIHLLYLLSYVVMIAFIVLKAKKIIKNPKIFKVIWWVPGALTMFLGSLGSDILYNVSYDYVGIAFIALGYELVFTNKESILKIDKVAKNVGNNVNPQQGYNVNQQPYTNQGQPVNNGAPVNQQPYANQGQPANNGAPVNQQSYANQGQPVNNAASVNEQPYTNPMDELKKYQDMLTAGTITPEEYEAKRKEIMAGR